MSAVNVIINTVLSIHLAFFFCLAWPGGSAAAPADSPAEGSGTVADQLDRMTEQAGPGAPRSEGIAASAGISRLDVLSIIDADEQGEGFYLPYYVFCDKTTDETYVVDNGRITVYGDNYFPVASLGAGRGAVTVQGVYVDGEGKVYAVQAAHNELPSRISVYNAAFLPVRQIELVDIPGLGGANPKSLVIGKNGSMYVAFTDGVRGLLVLDRAGSFSHWLRPTDLVFDQEVIVEQEKVGDLAVETSPDSEVDGEVEAAIDEEPGFDVSELLPELVPRESEQVFAGEAEPGLGPVQVNDVQRDSDGNLYLLSTETSKVYIYTPEEEFLYSFGEKGGSTGKLSQPRQLVVEEKKKVIYIVDYNRHAILIYDLSGRFMHEFGGKGNRPGWFQYPRSIAANRDGELLVADMFNRRVQVLDVRFQYKFPLFQVPFVYEDSEDLLPQPVQAANDRFYGPGFEAGEQAVTEPVDSERRRIKTLLEGG
jgi:DNA-binding beta-propeller fold protein YncE